MLADDASIPSLPNETGRLQNVTNPSCWVSLMVMEPTGRNLRLPRDEDAPATARDWIEDLAATLPAEIHHDLTLLTHELVTNAVQHSEGDSIWLAAVASPDAVRVEVCDEGGASEPHVDSPEPFSTSGRGLLWVKELSDRWGNHKRRVNHVWFQIDLASREVTRSSTRVQA